MSYFIAGIVTYNPDIITLEKNIEAIFTQVDKVVVVDNASNNINEISVLCISKGVDLVKNNKNYGVARALNQVFEFAINKYGNEVYVLTLDQDSVAYKDIICVYKNYIHIEDIASYSCLRMDRNYPVNEIVDSCEYEIVNKCITSGNLVKAKAWRECGGFDETLFIDMVDSEFCYKLRNMGYRILRVNRYELEHELGAPLRVRLFGKTRTVLNHNAFRKYYIFRNTIYILRKYSIARVDYSYWGLFKNIIGIILYENEKCNKLKRCFCGIVDGLKMKVN